MSKLLKEVKKDPLVLNTQKTLELAVRISIIKSDEFNTVLRLIPDTKALYCIVSHEGYNDGDPTNWVSSSIAGDWESRPTDLSKEDVKQCVLEDTTFYDGDVSLESILDANSELKEYFDKIYDLDEDSINAVGAALDEIAKVMLEYSLGDQEEEVLVLRL
jgi:hypothetical protein